MSTQLSLSLTRSFAFLDPSAFHGQSAKTNGFRTTGGSCSDCLRPLCAPQISQNAHASLLKLDQGRILVVISKILVKVFHHQLIRFGFLSLALLTGGEYHVCRDEGRDIQLWFSIEFELIVNELVCRRCANAMLGHSIFRKSMSRSITTGSRSGYFCMPVNSMIQCSPLFKNDIRVNTLPLAENPLGNTL